MTNNGILEGKVGRRAALTGIAALLTGCSGQQNSTNTAASTPRETPSPSETPTSTATPESTTTEEQKEDSRPAYSGDGLYKKRMLSQDDKNPEELTDEFLKNKALDTLDWALKNTSYEQELQNASSRDDIVEATLNNVTIGSGARQAREVALILDQFDNIKHKLPQQAQQYNFNRNNTRTDAQLMPIGKGGPKAHPVVHYQNKNGNLKLAGRTATQEDNYKTKMNIISDKGLFSGENGGTLMQDYPALNEGVERNRNRLEEHHYEGIEERLGNASTWGNLPTPNFAYTPEAGRARTEQIKNRDYEAEVDTYNKVTEFIYDNITDEQTAKNNAVLIDLQDGKLTPKLVSTENELYQEARKFRA